MARVLVTGSNSGIGLETALSFARSGHRVYATLRNLDRAATLLQQVGKEKLPVSVLQMDVDSDDSVAATIGLISNVPFANRASDFEIQYSMSRSHAPKSTISNLPSEIP